MVISFKDIANKMDPMTPSTSMKNLLSRFRYTDIPSGYLPNIASFKTAANRLNPDFGGGINFIHYNTWLLQATDLCNIKDALGISNGDLLKVLNIAPKDFINKLFELANISKGDICSKLFPPIVTILGVSVDPAYDLCVASNDIANFILESFDDAVNFVIGLFDVGCDVVLRVISVFTAPFGFDPQHIGGKPDLVSRANEIGPAVADYDIVSLVEVWVDQFRTAILSAQHHPLLKNFTGPADLGILNGKFLGSGILVFAPKYDDVIEDGTNYYYKYSGVSRKIPGIDVEVGPLFDADEFSTKGIQCTKIPVSINANKIGYIDLYSTHLSSGDPVAQIFKAGAPSDTENADTRHRQLQEMAAFIRETHDPTHIAIIAGDFNIKANNINEYPNFEDTLGNHLTLNDVNFIFDDWWNIIPLIDENTLTGYTNRNGADNDSDVENSFNQICQVYPKKLPVPTPIKGDDYYCKEEVYTFNNPPKGDGRIDYIFIERQTAMHSFYLDATRIRRRAFKREANPVNTELFLSDHLGLEITFYASPKI